MEPKWKIHAHGKMKILYRLPELLTRDEKIEFLKNFTTATFARHPFIRLVSTFKDKIIDHDYSNWRSMVNYKEGKSYKVTTNIIPIDTPNYLNKSYWHFEHAL